MEFYLRAPPHPNAFPSTRMAREHGAVSLLGNVWLAAAAILGAQGKTNTCPSRWLNRTGLGAHRADFG